MTASEPSWSNLMELGLVCTSFKISNRPARLPTGLISAEKG